MKTEIATQVMALFLVTGGNHLAFAHGEQAHGPHGGFIRMPGAFHTEVVRDGDRALKVYLLDLEFKNPTTESSTLKVKWVHEGKGAGLDCTKVAEHFRCELPEGASLSNGKLTLESKRNQAHGSPVTYDLPLKLPN